MICRPLQAGSRFQEPKWTNFSCRRGTDETGGVESIREALSRFEGPSYCTLTRTRPESLARSILNVSNAYI